MIQMTHRKHFLNPIRGVVFTIAFIFIAFGIYREEHLVVLKKAVNICLECIGIG